jgi:hypothetical protein
MKDIGDCLWAVIIFVALLLSTPLVDRLFRSGRSVGSRRGRLHSNTDERVSLTPAGARALDLWDDRE